MLCSPLYIVNHINVKYSNDSTIFEQMFIIMLGHGHDISMVAWINYVLTQTYIISGVVDPHDFFSHRGRSQKVLILGHLGCDLPCDFPQDARHLELSICYHKHSSHFRMLFLLSRTITILLPHHQKSHFDIAHRLSK